MMLRVSNLTHRTRATGLTLVLAMSLSACATIVDGQPYVTYVEDKNGVTQPVFNEGHVYYLPAPIIVVTPKPDGTASVEVEYLPDPERAYVVSARSFGAAYTFDVKTQNGLLTSVSLDANSTAIPSAVIETAGTIATKSLEEQNKDREAATKEAEADAEALETLRLNARLAQDKLDELEDIQGGDDAALAATVTPQKIVDARLELSAARTKLAQALGVSTASLGDDAYDAPPLASSAPGPVLFRVVQTGGGYHANVHLIKMTGDATDRYDSFTYPEETTPASSLSLVSESGPIHLKSSENDDLTYAIEFSEPIDGQTALKESELRKAGSDVALEPLSNFWRLKPQGEKLLVTIPAGFEKGQYFLAVAVKPDGADGAIPPATVQVSFIISDRATE